MIGTIYRPPKSQAADDIALCEEIISVIQNNQVVIVGDFNCSSIDWISMNGDREDNRLIEMAEDTFPTQFFIQPMRESNIQGLVFASDHDIIRDLKVGEKIDGCNHHLIRFNAKTKYTLTDNKTKITDYSLEPSELHSCGHRRARLREQTFGSREGNSLYESKEDQRYPQSTVDDNRYKKSYKPEENKSQFDETTSHGRGRRTLLPQPQRMPYAHSKK